MDVVSIGNLRRERESFARFQILKNPTGIVEMKPGSQEEAGDLEVAMRTICHACIGLANGTCSGFKDKNGKLQTATVSYTENQETAAERSHAIIRAGVLSHCGLLATALAMSG